MYKSAFPTNAQSRFASDSILDMVPRLPRLMVSLLLCSSGSNARHEVSRGLLKGIVSAQKALQARDGEKGVAGRNGREEYFPDEGLIDLPIK